MLLQCFFLDVVWDFYFFPSHLFFLSLSLVYAICFIIFSSPSPIFSFCTVLTTLPPLCHIGQSPSLFPSSSPSLLAQCRPPPPPPSPSPVSNAVYRQLQSHLSVQFIFRCSLWGRARGKTTSCLPKETSGSQGH